MIEPLVSAKMLTYNHRPFIKNAIEGILNQKTNFPYELVIGEDCSTDGTREIVFEYARKHPNVIRLITSERNVGAKQNSRRVDAACRGKYVAYCEGDDYWHRPDKLQLQADYLEKNHDCGLVHSDYDRFIVKENKLIKNFNEKTGNLISNNLDVKSILRGGTYLYILTCTVMIRNHLGKKIKSIDKDFYWNNNDTITDTAFWAEIASLSRTHYIKQSLSTYNHRESSASKHQNKISQLKFGKHVSESCLYMARKHKLPKSELDYHFSKWLDSSLPLAFYTQDKSIIEKTRPFFNNLTKKQQLFYLAIKYKIINQLASIVLAQRTRLKKII